METHKYVKLNTLPDNQWQQRNITVEIRQYLGELKQKHDKPKLKACS